MLISKKKHTAYFVAFFLFFLHVGCCADVQKEMLKFLDDIGSSANVTGPEIYQGQKAGYATAGGVTVRNRSVNLDPVQMTLPRFEAGCGGIDIYTGGFAFVDEEEIVNALKSIASSSAGYAFMLALECVSPQIASTMKQMQSWANQINSMGMNSCETAAALVGSVWPEDDLASEHICKTIGTENGMLKSMASSRHQCGTRKERGSSFKTSTDTSNREIIDYNVAWKAITSYGGIMKNKQMSELMMTMMGTIVVINGECKMFYPRAMDENFLRVLMEGGECDINSCDEVKQCLVINEQKLVVERGSSWTGRIEGLLVSIQQKIFDEQELTEEEVQLLSVSRIPLYKYIAIISAYKKGVCPLEMKQLAEVISLDLLLRFMRDTLQAVRMSCLNLKQNLPYSNKVDDYLESLKYVEISLNKFEERSVRLMEQDTSIIKKMDLLEKYIASELEL